MIRISITGTHSVGKTTIADIIAKHYEANYNVQRISEVARELIKQKFKMSKDITQYGIVNYAYKYLHQERIKQLGDILIADRSILDMMAYISVNNSKKVKTRYISLIDEIMYINKNKYDMYFYIPIEIPIVFDGVRPEDDKYRNDVDEMIKFLLNKYKINYYEVRGNIEERFNIISAAIDNELNYRKMKSLE